MFKIIKINAKRGYFLREPMWMRCGAQGHVTTPRGPARVPGWHNDDVYILYLIYYGYRTYKHSIEEFKLTYTFAPPFKLAILFNFFGVGLIFFDLFWSQDAWRHMDRRINDTMERVASMRWTRGPPDQERHTWLNRDLSDSSQPLISWIITVEITSDRWIHRHIAIVGSKSNRRAKSKPLLLHAMRSHLDPTSAIWRSAKEDVDSRNDISSRLFIAMSLSDRTAVPIFASLKTVLRYGRTGLWIFTKFSLCRPPIHMLFASL